MILPDSCTYTGIQNTRVLGEKPDARGSQVPADQNPGAKYYQFRVKTGTVSKILP
eukprot:SAG11_NODE_7080_length_1197_cov_1.367942_1_plen_54_part_10